MSDDSLLVNLESAKWIFVSIYVLATAGIALGVYLEEDHRSKETKRIGARILLWSLVADTLFTILIFATDGWISQVQKRQISQAGDRAAIAETTLAAYRKQRVL